MDAGQFVRHGTAMAHEGAHAVSGTGIRKVSGVTLNADATGATDMRGGGCLGGIVIGFAGYAGPSLFGLGAARLIQLGHSVAVLWVALFLLGLLATGLRRSYGLITVVVAGALVYAVGRYAPLRRPGRRRRRDHLDAPAVRGALGSRDRRAVQRRRQLSQLTMIPRVIWYLLWLAVSLVRSPSAARC